MRAIGKADQTSEKLHHVAIALYRIIVLCALEHQLIGKDENWLGVRLRDLTRDPPGYDVAVWVASDIEKRNIVLSFLHFIFQSFLPFFCAFSFPAAPNHS